MKKLLFLLLCLPLTALAAPTNTVKQFDKASEDFLLAKREHINPTASELKAIAKSEGIPLNNQKGFPVLKGTGEAAPRLSPGAGLVEPAKSYRTLGDAAKAGVDPLNLIKPMASSAAVPQSETRNAVYYYIGGFLLFSLLLGVGYLATKKDPDEKDAAS